MKILFYHQKKEKNKTGSQVRINNLKKEICKKNEYEIAEVGELGVRKSEFAKKQDNKKAGRLISDFARIIRTWFTLYKKFRNSIKCVVGRNIASVFFVGVPTFLSSSYFVWDIGIEPESEGLVRLMHILGFMFSDGIISQSDRVLEREFCSGDVQRFNVEDKFYVVPPGIQYDNLSFEAGVAADRESEDRPGDNESVILYVGSIHPRKNQTDLVRMSGLLEGLDSPIRLELVGGIRDESYAREIQNEAETLGVDVHLRGYSNDVNEFYQAADVFVGLSKKEGVSNVAQEAMAHGLPVVSNREDGIVQFIQSGRNGYVVEDSPESAAEAVKTLLENPVHREEVSRRARDTARREFNPTEWAERYLDALEEIVHSDV